LKFTIESGILAESEFSVLGIGFAGREGGGGGSMVDRVGGVVNMEG
jgi:hypothetical protein